MQKPLPTHAQAVIIGGGIHGCSVAYHLAREGFTDVILLERKRLTSGTTWHAAGLVGQLQGSHSTTAFASYGVELLESIEAETGQNPGFRKSGSISIAVNEERLAELRRKADFASLFGIEAHYMGVEAIAERWPLMNPEGVLGGIHMPSDGSANATDLTNALAKGARMHGAQIRENVRVDEVVTDGGRVTGVRTDQGTIMADVVVNCAGMWARELGARNGVGVPLHACEHYYLVTEPIPDLPADLPVLRSYCDGTYWKEDAGKLLFGFAHFHAKPWATGGIPEAFEFDSLPFVEEDVTEVLELAMNRVPLLQETGIRTFFNGPESYSHDGRFTLGEAPSLRGYYVLAGVNSTGIQSGPGAGKALADWIRLGHPPMDLAEMDPARCEDFQTRDPYLRERCPETLVLTYAMHWPGRQRQSARNLRRTPFHHAMKAQGAVFGEAQGWERPGWFAPEGVAPVYDHSFHRPTWFDHAQAEQKAAREGVGIIDYSMLGKTMVEGRGAEAFLQRVCTNDMALAPGRVAYSLMLNERGGIESDVTVSRHADDAFMVMSSISHGLRPVGGEALNALRIEKGFVHWGHDMAYTEAPHQVGLGFACKPDKATPFIGRDAFLARREAGEGPYLCAIRLRDPGPLLHHNEPVLRDGVVAGFVTSGAWCRAGGAATGLCFVNMPEGGAGRGSLKDGAYSVMVEGRAVPADLSLSPFHDPKNARMLG